MGSNYSFQTSSFNLAFLINSSEYIRSVIKKVSDITKIENMPENIIVNNGFVVFSKKADVKSYKQDLISCINSISNNKLKQVLENPENSEIKNLVNSKTEFFTEQISFSNMIDELRKVKNFIELNGFYAVKITSIDSFSGDGSPVYKLKFDPHEKIETFEPRLDELHARLDYLKTIKINEFSEKKYKEMAMHFVSDLEVRVERLENSIEREKKLFENIEQNIGIKKLKFDPDSKRNLIDEYSELSAKFKKAKYDSKYADNLLEKNKAKKNINKIYGEMEEIQRKIKKYAKKNISSSEFSKLIDDYLNIMLSLNEKNQSLEKVKCQLFEKRTEMFNETKTNKWYNPENIKILIVAIEDMTKALTDEIAFVSDKYLERLERDYSINESIKKFKNNLKFRISGDKNFAGVPHIYYLKKSNTSVLKVSTYSSIRI